MPQDLPHLEADGFISYRGQTLSAEQYITIRGEEDVFSVFSGYVVGAILVVILVLVLTSRGSSKPGKLR